VPDAQEGGTVVWPPLRLPPIAPNAEADLAARQAYRGLECGVALRMAWELGDRPVSPHEEDRLTHELCRELAGFDVLAGLHME
jgi:hypothetical protein